MGTEAAVGAARGGGRSCARMQRLYNACRRRPGKRDVHHEVAEVGSARRRNGHALRVSAPSGSNGG
jgi:hypothetical protein